MVFDTHRACLRTRFLSTRSSTVYAGATGWHKDQLLTVYLFARLCACARTWEGSCGDVTHAGRSPCHYLGRVRV